MGAHLVCRNKKIGRSRPLFGVTKVENQILKMEKPAMHFQLKFSLLFAIAFSSSFARADCAGRSEGFLRSQAQAILEIRGYQTLSCSINDSSSYICRASQLTNSRKRVKVEIGIINGAATEPNARCKLDDTEVIFFR